MPKARLKMPNKKMYLWVFGENTILKETKIKRR